MVHYMVNIMDTMPSKDLPVISFLTLTLIKMVSQMQTTGMMIMMEFLMCGRWMKILTGMV